MLKGCKIVFARSYKSSDILEDIQQNGVKIMCGVPLMFEKMFLGFNRKIGKLPVHRRLLFSMLFRVSCTGLRLNRYWGKYLFRSVLEKAGLDRVRMFVSGGAALPFRVGQFLNALGLATVQGYGLSETSPVLSVNPVERNRYWTVGPPLNGVEIRVLQTDTSRRGQIAARGPMVMMGYFKNPEATAEVIKDGWFLTGDIGSIDSDGYLTITGRSKNVIVSSAGKNIYPEEIEAYLNLSPLILESLVMGMKSRTTGEEEIAAVIVPNRESIMQSVDSPNGLGQHDIENMVRDEVRSVCARLADFKRVKQVYISYEELPKTTTKKIKRTVTIDSGGKLIEKKDFKAALTREVRDSRQRS
jgi:long-chain acyl-CoA synthetase